MEREESEGAQETELNCLHKCKHQIFLVNTDYFHTDLLIGEKHSVFFIL